MAQLHRIARFLFVMVLLCLGSKAAMAQGTPPQAHFVVGDSVVAPAVRPFDTTIGHFGNGRRLMPNGGFEPLILRTMFVATGGDRKQITALQYILSNFDSWQGGALDGAEVEILRIEDGAFRSVRRDRVAEGGHRVSGWIRHTRHNHVIPPDQSNVTFSFPPFFRNGVPIHFTVRSVNAEGALSDPGEVVALALPQERVRNAPQPNLIALKSIENRSDRLAPPRNLRGGLTEDGQVHLEWEPVEGAAGYMIYRSDVPPRMHEPPRLLLEGDGPSVLEGDLVILRKRSLRADRGKLLSNRFWNTYQAAVDFRPRLVRAWPDALDGGDWHLMAHPDDTPVSEPGETHLRVTLKKGETLKVGNTNHAGTGQNWYDILDPDKRYRFEVWMRGKAIPQVQFQLSGPYSHKTQRVRPVAFRITGDWTLYSGTVTVPKVLEGAGAGAMELLLTGPGEYDLDNFRVFLEDAPYMAWLPEDVDRLEASGMGTLRTHGLIKTARRSYDLAQLTNPGGVTSARTEGNTLPQSLEGIARVGANPWLQIEPHLSREEWLGLAEFLAAPFDPATDDPSVLPWAAKRYGQGRAAPWIDAFDEILLELGNETWNRLFSPWAFPDLRDAKSGQHYRRGEVYGLYQDYVLSILKESPHWERLSDGLTVVTGGHSGTGKWKGFDYAFDAARLSPDTEFVGHAGYIGGWDENEGPATPDAAGLQRVLTHVLRKGVPAARRNTERLRTLEAARGAPVGLGIYEAGPGYAMNGLNNQSMTKAQTLTQRQAMQSVAAGTATLDNFLMRARAGQVRQAYFLYGVSAFWSSHSRWYDGGQTQPAWDLLSLFNRVGPGDMLEIQTLEVPRQAIEGKPLAALRPDPMVAAYATRSADRVTLVLVSRRVPFFPKLEDDGATDLRVDLPFTQAERVTRHAMTGQWNSHNIFGREARIVAEDLTPSLAVPRLETVLPPGGTVVYVFEGVR